MPGYFTWANGGETVGLIPSRYPGSQASADGSIRLARKTEWLAQDADVYVGAGQRMLATDQGEYPLLDVREISLDTLESGSQTAVADTESGASDG